jgi:threonine/homoserine/homoserine lactone efflux protein
VKPKRVWEVTLHIYLAYVATCIIIVIVPGPTVTLVVANSLRDGARAGLLNVAGSQLGFTLMIGIVLAGLASLIEAVGWWFDWVRFAGAAYLVWLGVKLLRSSGSLVPAQSAQRPRVGYFLQGFLVMMSNPKALLLFGALFPQFINPDGNYVKQVLLLGVTSMVIAFVSDSAYAILSGRAASLLATRRVRLLSRGSGLCLIGGGAWLALSRSR